MSKQSSGFKNQPYKPQGSHFDHHVKTGHSGYDEYEETITEDGRTKKVTSKTIQKPDGSYEKVYNEEIIENYTDSKPQYYQVKNTP